jgi:hypothetical protein
MNKIVAASKIETEKDFLGFISDEATKSGNLSTRGVERCCGVGNNTLIKSVGYVGKKLGQTLTSHGFYPVDLTRDGWPPAAVWLAIEYFAWESKAKAPMAKQLARTFGAFGVKNALDHLKPRTESVNLAQWQEERQSGKVVRRSLTDMIALFIQYAEAQGCLSGKWYYTNFSSLVNKYIIEGYPKSAKGIKDKRDRMVESQLRHIKNMEDVLARIISDGMDAGDGYHDIYEACKSRVSAVAAVLYVDPLPLLPESNRKVINQQLAKALKAS